VEGLRMTVRVKPGASRTRVAGAYGDDRQLVVAVNAPPVDGAANDAVVEALADALAVRRRAITIVSGHTARSKVVHIDSEPSEIEALRARVVALLDA
jgi:uncharacterized protein (TIGR00251 family)